MKKKTALLLASMLLFSVGCGKEDPQPEQPQSEIQTEFRFAECGLAYTIPDEWVEMENTNLIPSPTVTPDGDIYARICYHYAPDENLAALNDTASDIPVEELMTPLVELLVVKEENLETDSFKEALASFSSIEELPAQEDFRFYYLTGYADGIDHFSDTAKETFTTLEGYLPKLRESIETFLPDVASVQHAAEQDAKHLTFLSNTLQGDPVSSAIFYDYEMTVVNFWASYCLDDGINELETLQKFYTNLQKKYPDVNFVQVVIDTPTETAEEAALAAYADAGVTFTGIMPDEHLAKWIMENLNGLPTTIFVDQQGIPRDFKIEGMQDAKYYLETTKNMLDASAQ